MFNKEEIGRYRHESTSSPRKAKPEMQILNPNDPDVRVFAKLPENYQDFIVQKIRALGDKVSQNDKITIVKYFLRKYEEFVKFFERAEVNLKPPNPEEVKLSEELSSVARDVDKWFMDLVRKHESGRQSSPNRVM